MTMICIENGEIKAFKLTPPYNRLTSIVCSYFSLHLGPAVPPFIGSGQHRSYLVSVQLLAFLRTFPHEHSCLVQG